METVLHIFLILLVVNLILTNSRSYLLAGIITGLSVWVRPDGMTLLGPLVFAILLAKSPSFIKLRGLINLAIGFGALFLPYLLFNLAVSGTPMPNTFYAKQAEYASWQAIPFGERLFLFSLQFFLGASFVLILGFVSRIIAAVLQRNWGVLLTVVWVVGYILLYLLRLPVYQHARYLMPALAVFMVIGLKGFLENLALYRRPLLRMAGTISLFALMPFCSFLVLMVHILMDRMLPILKAKWSILRIGWPRICHQRRWWQLMTLVRWDILTIINWWIWLA